MTYMRKFIMIFECFFENVYKILNMLKILKQNKLHLKKS